MTKQAKINWVLGGILVIALYYLIRSKNPQINASELNYNLVLSKGSFGAEVMELQRRIKEKFPDADLGNTGENQDGIDGDFGDLTLNALKKYTGQDSTTLNKANF